MDKKRSVILLVQIVIFVIVLVLFTVGAGNKTLQARIKVGTLFLVLGLITLKFKRPIAEWTYKRQVGVIKEHSSIEKVTEGFNHGGILLSSVGAILILIGLIFK
jgi:hypothetical protein